MDVKKYMKHDMVEILIVEDNPTEAEQLKYLIEENGYTVNVAANGAKALGMLREKMPTLIVSDITMPEMDGYELCRAIKADDNFKAIPVILVTRLSAPQDIIKGLECGADNFIVKPYEEKYLLTRIRYILTNQELRKKERTETGVGIVFGGQKYIITAERRQILDLLLSTYETAVHKNAEVVKARDELRQLNEQLEKTIEERTAALSEEIAVRTRTEEELVRLYQQIKEEAEVAGSLLKMFEALSSSLDEKQIIKNVINLAPNYLKFHRIAIFIYDEEFKGFSYSGGYGFNHIEEGILISSSFRRGDFPAIDKVLKGETVLIENASQNDLIGKELVETLGITGAVIVPISAGEKAVGGIYGDYKTLRPIEKKDVSFLRGLADGIAIVLQNSRLYRVSVEKQMELSGKIETIETMAQLDREILSSIDRSSILRIAVSLVNRVMPSDRTAIVLRGDDSFRVASEGGMGIFKDKIYSIKGSHMESFEKSRNSLYISDISKEDCPYHKDQYALGIKSALMIPIITKDGIIGLLDIGSAHRGKLTPDNLSTAEKIASQIAVALENARLYEDLQQLMIGTITSLASAIDAKSPWTNGHSERVTKYALKIGKEMGLDEHDLEWLRLSGLLHDVGKIGTYDDVLDKPGKLTDEEFEIVKKHPRKGAEILASIKQLSDVIPGVLYHHERYDGRGYPDGLKGEDIPLQARILCVADSYDSMTADRPYRSSSGKEFAVAEFKRCSGSQFDPKVVETFIRVIEKPRI